MRTNLEFFLSKARLERLLSEPSIVRRLIGMQDVIFDKVAHLAHFNLLVVLEQQMKLQADRRPVNCFSYMSKTGLIAELKNICAFIMGADCLSGRPLA